MTTNIQSNVKPIHEIIEEVKAQLASQTKSWRMIAEAFCEAKAMYGGDSPEFRRLYKQTKLSRSTAFKLAAIAASDRLERYNQKLSRVHSWGTLYVIHSLKEDRFEALKRKFKLDDANAEPPVLTQAMVEAIGKDKAKSEPNPMVVYAKITIDIRALKGQLIDGEDLAAINAELDEIQNLCRYVRIDRSNVDERVESTYLNQVQREYKKIVSKAFWNYIKNDCQAHDPRKGAPKNATLIKVYSMNREELEAALENDPAAAFERVGHEYDEARLYDEAMETVEAKRQSFAELMEQSRLAREGKTDNGRSQLIPASYTEGYE